MAQRKQDYESPTTDVFVLCFENGILITSDPLNNSDSGYDPDSDLGSI